MLGESLHERAPAGRVDYLGGKAVRKVGAAVDSAAMNTRRRKTTKLKRRKGTPAAHRRAVAAVGRETNAARLARGLSEALEQQTATLEVLRLISSSPGELAPVFQAILENAVRICEAKFGMLHRFDQGRFRFAAEVGTPLQLSEFQRRRGPFLPVL